MNALTQTTAYDWVDSLGWTLLHSLWQSLIIFLIVAGISRLGSSLRSNVRYTIACGGLVFAILLNVITFLDLSAESTAQQSAVFSETFTYQNATLKTVSSLEEGLITTIVIGLEQMMPWLVIVWAIGFMLFALRSLIALFASYGIRSEAKPIGGEWDAHIQRVAHTLGIRRIVRIAESTRINGPMVMGYFKPLILIPVGMIGGLSTQQLETIFLHELAHIRRHDYLVNLLQIIVESIFFFNPFVRMLSNTIRREREYCCDDVVVALHGNTSAYAHALVRIAENQLASPILALSLVANKNELFNRIKRIMEHSASKYSNKRHLLISAMLLVAAFACVSWMGADKDNDERGASSISPADTLPADDEFTARYSRRTIITIDENGQPHEEIIQEFHGDEELRSIMEGKMSGAFNDSIPPFAREQWDAFADAFDKEFREDFQSLFRGNVDPRELMEQFEKEFRLNDWGSPFEEIPMDSLKELREGDIFKNFREEFEKFRGFNLQEMEHFRKNPGSPGTPAEAYERALREALIEDGYLSPEDRIESLEWNDESFKVNGEHLRKEDIKKYNDLRKNTLERSQSGTLK